MIAIFGAAQLPQNKNGKPNIAPLQPPTLAAFRPWGSSAGAGRADLPRQRYSFAFGSQNFLLHLFMKRLFLRLN